MAAMTSATYTASMNRLIDQLSRLPGVGKRSAERMVFHLLKGPADDAFELASAIRDLRQQTRTCSVCGHVGETDPCGICTDPERDHRTVLVVEQPRDLLSIETTGMYRGVYHVLMGRLAPLDGVGPGELNIAGLLERIDHSARGDQPVQEVILGTNPTVEGDGTAMYLAAQLAQRGVKVSRLARGLPSGTDLERASKAMLSDALYGRQAMEG
jgi:recombination protein RecR